MSRAARELAEKVNRYYSEDCGEHRFRLLDTTPTAAQIDEDVRQLVDALEAMLAWAGPIAGDNHCEIQGADEVRAVDDAQEALEPWRQE